MTLELSLDKQRVDFSHNYTKIRIKCPECIRTIKGQNHVKVYKNLAGLWRHIKLEHGEISNLEFNTNLIKEILKHISLAIKFGMFPGMDEIVDNTTTSLSIIYDGKPARIDVRNKLKEIAEIMKGQSSMYPDFKTDNILAYMKIVLGNSDERTKKRYFDCITNYSNKNWQNGTYNVTAFCEQF